VVTLKKMPRWLGLVFYDRFRNAGFDVLTEIRK
jgi:hypothetical protein